MEKPGRFYRLSEEQWSQIKDCSHRRKGCKGFAPKESNRKAFEAVLYRERTGCSWRDVPAFYPGGAHHLHALAAVGGSGRAAKNHDPGRHPRRLALRQTLLISYEQNMGRSTRELDAFIKLAHNGDILGLKTRFSLLRSTGVVPAQHLELIRRLNSLLTGYKIDRMYDLLNEFKQHTND